MAARFLLRPVMFDETKRPLLNDSPFTANVFKYESGVEAIEFSNGPVVCIVLPYQGQQVWRLFIDGENMTMKSMYESPESTDDVFNFSYGGFLIHCGLTAMGNPSEEDDHPMHGELPHAKYRNVYVEVGEDGKGRYVSIGGDYIYKLSIDTGYVFSPELRLYEGSKLIEVSGHIKNLRAGTFNYMYMAHINWLPINGSRLVYSTPKDNQNIEVCREDFGDVLDEEDAKRLDDYTSSLQKNPSLSDVIDFETQCYNPELCSIMHYRADEEGWAHAMQIRPDQTSCYVGFDTSILNNGLRWFSWTEDERSCGFALPNTGNQKGRAYAIKNGLMKQLPGYGEALLRYRFGKLGPMETVEMENRINSILKNCGQKS